LLLFGTMPLPSRVKATILLTIAAAAVFAAALVIWLPPPNTNPWLIAFSTLVGLAVFASMLDLRITEGGTTTSMDFLPQLGSLLLLGPVGAIGLTTATMLFKQFVLQRKPVYKAAFNTAQTVLALGAAGLAYSWFGGGNQMTSAAAKTAAAAIVSRIVALTLLGKGIVPNKRSPQSKPLPV
ncbi:MAG: hypothetical protein P8Y07_03310, partial [Gemmatimonadales bacterium]